MELSGRPREPGEDAEATARRELFEETGLTVGPLVRLGAFRPRRSVAASCSPSSPRAPATGEPRAGDDAAQAEFVPFAAVLARPLTAGRAGLDRARASSRCSEPPLL